MAVVSSRFTTIPSILPAKIIVSMPKNWLRSTQTITPAYGGVASPAVSPDGRRVVYVFSDGKSDFLAVVDADGKKWPQKIMSGADFYMQPTWHPQGKYLAWVEWDNPHMPWDQTRLKIAKVNQNPNLELGELHQLVDEDETVIFQPEFSPDGKYCILYLYAWKLGCIKNCRSRKWRNAYFVCPGKRPFDGTGLGAGKAFLCLVAG